MRDGPLVDGKVVARHEESYKSTDHSYPNENIVRLIKWYFPKPPGRVLDYGFGPGENLIHLAKLGYSPSGVEVSERARLLTEEKCERRLGTVPYLYLMTEHDSELPFISEVFEAVLCNQTAYFLVTEERIKYLLSEFRRVLAPGGKLILTMASRMNSMCFEGTPIGGNAYEHSFKGHIADAPDDMPNRVYIVRDEQHCRDLVGKFFLIDEIGHFDNYYCGMAGHHYVILARKAG